MRKQRKLQTFQVVWVGYVDGRPYVYDCEIDGARCVAVYTSRKEARKHYQDVRKSILRLQDDTVGDVERYKNATPPQQQRRPI